MIEVSKLNGDKYYVNAETIDFIEEAPDTVLTLASGKKLLVLEPPHVIIERIIAYKQLIYLNRPQRLADTLEQATGIAERQNRRIDRIEQQKNGEGRRLLKG